jgi:hypothetical protein
MAKSMITTIILRLFTLFCTLGPDNAEAAAKLMIFGGKNHDVYLGCLNCSEYAIDSVHNEFSKYGSEFSSQSIFNSFSIYGSKFSSLSPCNEFATEPPIIVDEEGNFYGRLTLNTYHRQANTNESLIRWLKYSVCK